MPTFCFFCSLDGGRIVPGQQSEGATRSGPGRTDGEPVVAHQPAAGAALLPQPDLRTQPPRHLAVGGAHEPRETRPPPLVLFTEFFSLPSFSLYSRFREWFLLPLLGLLTEFFWGGFIANSSFGKDLSFLSMITLIQLNFFKYGTGHGFTGFYRVLLDLIWFYSGLPSFRLKFSLLLY